MIDQVPYFHLGRDFFACFSHVKGVKEKYRKLLERTNLEPFYAF